MTILEMNTRRTVNDYYSIEDCQTLLINKYTESDCLLLLFSLGIWVPNLFFNLTSPDSHVR